MQAYAEALLIIPKVLAQNSGFDQQDTIVKLQEEYFSAHQPVGIDINTGQFSCATHFVLQFAYSNNAMYSIKCIGRHFVSNCNN